MNSTAFWNKQAQGFNAGLGNELKDLLKKTKPYLNPSYDVLDYGCATGLGSIDIAPLVNSVHGLDYSSEMIRLAKENLKSGNYNNVTFQTGTLDLLTGKPQQFDVIIAYNVLHLVDDLDQTLSDINNLLKPGGGLFISNSACLGEKRSFGGLLIKGVSKLGIFPTTNSFTSEALLSKSKSYNFSLLRKELTRESVPNLYLVEQK